MKKLFAAALAAAALYACTPGTPCVDAECASIAGHYRASWDLDGGTLQKTGDGGVCTFVVLGGWDLAQTGSAVVLDAGVLSMTGTLYKDNSLSLTGGTGGLSTSLTAFATAGSAATDGGAFVPASLRGQLVGNSFDADGNTCLSIVAFTATQL